MRQALKRRSDSHYKALSHLTDSRVANDRFPYGSRELIELCPSRELKDSKRYEAWLSVTVLVPDTFWKVAVSVRQCCAALSA